MMSQEQMEARHLVELGFLEAIIDEMGYPTQLVEKSEQVPFHTLLVGLEPDARQRPRQMALTFYPVSRDDVENTLFLQYFVELPFEVDEQGLERVVQLLPHVNNAVVLGHFGITAGQGKIHHRYVQTLPWDKNISREAVVDVFVLTSYTPVLFEKVLEELARDSIDVEQAKARVDAIYAQM